MGTTPSMPSSRKRPLRRSFRSPFRRTSTQGTLSATFNFIEPNMKLNQLNINVATEEELMTLPGVTRGVAKNIIEYRNVIGKFNKVEDLALVSGIGADKLDEIRPEICVSRGRNQSSGSSEGSPESLPVDVNKANVFELMTIRGLGQELAAAIVHYRERRGDFFNISDILKVKGMDETKFNYLKPRLCLKSDSFKLNKRVLSEPRIPNGGAVSDIYPFFYKSDTPRKDTSPVACQGDLYELVSQQCERPPLKWDPLPFGEVRFATWNLTDMCHQKAANTAVRETFCLTLLENRISFVAVQDVQDSFSLHMLCSELNAPSCRKVSQWPESRGSWESQFFGFQDKQGLGFIYDTNVFSNVIARDIQNNSMMRAVVATITEHGSGFSVLNVQLLANSDGSSFNTLTSSVRPFLVVGDLSHIIEDNSSLPNYVCLLPGTKTNVNTSIKTSFNNIYIKESEISKFTGVSGIILEGLRHLAIPDGWAWGGPVSHHAPLWGQIRI
ncbi:endonuclease/exonuclease/phosphatase family domain-containing protein 1 isoform X1 [Halyomorpha halys]|uniref:endonuclease/exonuclease/phosphatase family domain-containing protein 1 isoform X1 n=1 Tax=Halyomorpha halys TaxID=286706 RepID=UPI0006D4EC53|nr:endonuclease/exonuclease/phosphatase family domain-containing protein 1-like isoform X1 [Halyomorpha halys]